MLRRWPLSLKGTEVRILALALFLSAARPVAAQERFYRRNLVFDCPGVALKTDSGLVNLWGARSHRMVPSGSRIPDGPFNPLLFGRRESFPVGLPLVITISRLAGVTSAALIGIVFNSSTEFVAAFA